MPWAQPFCHSHELWHTSLCAPLRVAERKNVLAQTHWPPLGSVERGFLSAPREPLQSWAFSESGGSIFIPQPAQGVPFPHPGDMRATKTLLHATAFPEGIQKMVACCNCSFTKHVFACLSIMQAKNTDQRKQNCSSPTALMLMTLGWKLKVRLISLKSPIRYFALGANVLQRGAQKCQWEADHPNNCSSRRAVLRWVSQLWHLGELKTQVDC